MQSTQLAYSYDRLENGDRCTADEFMRLYRRMPGYKAELLDGVVHIHFAYDGTRKKFVASPVNPAKHGRPHARMAHWLGEYVLETPGTDFGDNSTIRMSVGDTVPQPDLYLRILPECGGRTKDLPNGEIIGAPELIVEICWSSRGRDYGPKLLAYQRNRVREYVIWRVGEKAIDWFNLKGSKYQKVVALGDIYKSEAFPGLWLDANAMLSEDHRKVHRVLHQGLRSADHQAFVKRLAGRKGK